MRRVLVLLAAMAAFVACTPSRGLPPPFIANEFPSIDANKGRCVEVEREPDAGGGLRIPRQTVCPTFAPDNTNEEP